MKRRRKITREQLAAWERKQGFVKGTPNDERTGAVVDPAWEPPTVPRIARREEAKP